MNDILEILGIYISGSNVSLIKITENKRKEDIIYEYVVKLRTINGVRKANGMLTLKIKICNIEKNMNFFIVDTENFNGLYRILN